MAGIGLDPANLGQPAPHVFPIAIAGSFVIGYGMAWLLGRMGVRGAVASMQTGAIVAALLVATTLAVHHAFSTHTIAVMLVDGAKDIVAFALVGLVIGAMTNRESAAES